MFFLHQQNDPGNRLFNIKLLECLQGQKIWMEALDQCDRILDVLHWSEEALQCVVSFNEVSIGSATLKKCKKKHVIRDVLERS